MSSTKRRVPPGISPDSSIPAIDAIRSPTASTIGLISGSLSRRGRAGGSCTVSVRNSSGRLDASRSEMIEPREFPATCAGARSSVSMSPARSATSWSRCPWPGEASLWLWPRRSYVRTRNRAASPELTRSQTWWSPHEPCTSTTGSPSPTSS